MIESPCIGVCTVVEGKCIGCFRTSEEIVNWLYYTDEERNKIRLWIESGANINN